MEKKDVCPKCLGTKKYMVTKKIRRPFKSPKSGFKYKECTFCDDKGMVPTELNEVYHVDVFGDE